MQVTLEETGSLERKMRISVPADQIETKVEAKLKQTAGQVRIKGFRPGKVPIREVKRRFGDEIRQEVSSEVMQTSFSEALQQENVSPAGQPRIEDVTMESGQDLEFTAIFEVFPEIIPADTSAIEVERPVAEVTEADVDKMIETLQEQNLEYEEVARAATDDDKVNVDFTGYLDGEAFEGGKAEGADIVIGQGGMIEGFEAGLKGLSAGDEKDLTLTFPEEYQNQDLAGKETVFSIKVNTVSEPNKPELDDEFFKQFGVQEGGLEAFRDEVRRNMEKELQAAIKNRVKARVMDELLRINEVEIPRALVENEINRQRQEAVQRFGGGQQIDPSVLPAEMFEQQAERSVTLGLLMNALIEAREIKVDDERVKAMIEDLASSYEEPEQVINFYYGNEQQLNQIQNMVLEEQVVDALLADGNVTDVEMSYEEAIKPPEHEHDHDHEDGEAPEGPDGDGDTADEGDKAK